MRKIIEKILVIANFLDILDKNSQVLMEQNMDLPERDGDGYLLNMDDWSEEVGQAMADLDGVTLDDQKWGHIKKAREYYDEYSVVPPIRKFSQYVGEDKKVLFTLWQTGPMKPITKYGGLPKPTGCV
jgi:TusE/DsrC/DsvC family sulfur relay protein